MSDISFLYILNWRHKMNKYFKRVLEFLAIVVITAVVAISSPLNPWISNAFTQMQEEILDIAYSVRAGYLAYVELDGHYGPVVYEFWGLGFLPTDTHIVQFIMEAALNFVSILFIYKTAKLYTSEIFSWVTAALIAILEWGSLTHSGAEMFVFFIMSLTCYHAARQLKSGMLSHHTYLLAIDLGVILFVQPSYVIFWTILIIFFAIKFKVDGIEGKNYKTFWFSTIEGFVTVSVPMGLYLWYFKNGDAFLKNVVAYNTQNIGSFAQGIKAVCGTPWTISLLVLLVVIIIKIIKGEKITDLCIWLGIIMCAIIVVALQGGNYDSFKVAVRPLYVVPLASLLSFFDKPLGLKIEERDK